MRRREHASGPASSAEALSRPLRGSTLQRKASVISRHDCGVGGAERCLERALSAARPYVISRTVLFPLPLPHRVVTASLQDESYSKRAKRVASPLT